MICSLADRLGVQSWSFRCFKTNAEVAEALTECGVTKVELGHSHVNPAAGEARKIVEFYAGLGIEVTSIGLFRIGPDEARAREVFEFARTAELPAFTGDVTPGGMPIAEKLCQEYGVRLAVHNHGRQHRYGPSWAATEMLAQTSPNIGLCLDTAWAIDSGDDPVALVKRHASRLYGVHVKDFVFDRAGKPVDVAAGQGVLDLDGLLRALLEIGFSGYLTAEYEGDAEDPVPPVRRCVEAVRQALGRLASRV
jgi:inosose dehydratase